MDGYFEHTERLDGFQQAHALPLDGVALGLERVLDLVRAHRAVELVLVARLDAELQRDRDQLVPELLRRLALLRLLGHAGALAIPEHGARVPDRLDRLLARNEKVAGVAVGHLDRGPAL